MPHETATRSSWLLLVRHGATAANEAHPPKVQGRRTDTDLSPLGRRQAEELGLALQAWNIGRVCASPLRRAQQTAATAVVGRGLSVEVLDALTEVDVGRWEGRTWAEIAAQDPEACRAFQNDPAEHPYAGGESLADVERRVTPVLDDLLLRPTAAVTLVVAHNVVNRAYLARYLGVPLRTARGIQQHNGGVNVLRCDAGQIRLIALNAMLHLSDAHE